MDETDISIRSIAPATRAPTAGTTLGAYRIHDRLGAGAMGVVYRAVHEHLQKVVALKVLPPSLATDPERIARFRKEMRAIGSVEHPNVVRALDAGEIDGTLYLAMELVPGTSLDKVLRDQGPLPISQACDYIRQAALGLQHSHDIGLIHRDLKPSNLMLTPDGVVKILDLGLARLRGQSGGVAVADAAIDQPHSGTFQQASGVGSVASVTGVCGTPDYMAPEQWVGQPTKQSDLYSLGCLFYHLLTGKPPFVGDGWSMRRKMLAHIQTQAPDVRRLRRDVPEQLALLTKRLMCKSPDDRPASALEVADALAPFATPVDAPQSESGPQPSWTKRHRRLVVGLGVVTVAVVLLWMAVAYLPRPRHSTNPVAGQGFVQKPNDSSTDGSEYVVNPQVATAANENLVALFQVRRFEYQSPDSLKASPVGVISESSMNAFVGNFLTVAADFREPAFAFLVAVNPDGRIQLCVPESDQVRPVRGDGIRYPNNKTPKGLRLTQSEGAGLQAIVLIASKEPLPAFNEWRQATQAFPEQQRVAAPQFWRFETRNSQLELELPQASDPQVDSMNSETPYKTLIDSLKPLASYYTMWGIAFPVRERPASD